MPERVAFTLEHYTPSGGRFSPTNCCDGGHYRSLRKFVANWIGAKQGGFKLYRRDAWSNEIIDSPAKLAGIIDVARKEQGGQKLTPSNTIRLFAEKCDVVDGMPASEGELTYFHIEYNGQKSSFGSSLCCYDLYREVKEHVKQLIGDNREYELYSRDLWSTELIDDGKKLQAVIDCHRSERTDRTAPVRIYLDVHDVVDYASKQHYSYVEEDYPTIAELKLKEQQAAAAAATTALQQLQLAGGLGVQQELTTMQKSKPHYSYFEEDLATVAELKLKEQQAAAKLADRLLSVSLQPVQPEVLQEQLEIREKECAIRERALALKEEAFERTFTAYRRRMMEAMEKYGDLVERMEDVEEEREEIEGRLGAMEKRVATVEKKVVV